MREIFITSGVVWGILSIVCILIAWRAIRARQVMIHKHLMTFMVLGSWVFVVLYFAYKFSPSAAQDVPMGMLIWLGIHGLIAVVTLALASILMVTRLKQLGADNHFIKHHVQYGRWILPLWLFTHLGGLFNAWVMG